MVAETSQATAHIARELNVNETTPGNWVKEYREAPADDEPALPVSEAPQYSLAARFSAHVGAIPAASPG